MATVLTCGGVAAAATAVGMVSCGIATASVSSTLAAVGLIGSATVYGLSFLGAAVTSNSPKEFADKGNWGTVVDTLVGAGIGMVEGYGLYKAQTSTASSISSNTTNTPKIKYPGNDPTKCNTPNFEWRGSGAPASGRGNFVNMKTGEWLHPDLNHGPPSGPHWDYGIRGDSQTFRIFPDGSILPK